MGPWWTIAWMTGCAPPPGHDALTTTDTGASTADSSVPTNPTATGAYGVFSAKAERADVASVLRITWNQESPASVHVVFGFDGELRTSPVRELAAGAHEELLLGVPFDTEVTWHLVLEGGSGEQTTPEVTTRTGPLPDGFPDHALETVVPGGFDAGVPYLLVSIDEGLTGGFLGGAWYATLMDRQGRVVWAKRSERGKVTMYARISAAGDSILVDQNSYWGSFDGGRESQVLELRMDGTEVSRWDTRGLHHSFVQLPDGSLVYGSYVGRFGAYLEEVHRRFPDGTVQPLFLCGDWLLDIGEGYQPCGSNTVSYHAANDSVLVSWFTFEALTEIALSDGAVLRTIGHVTGGYGFDPPESAFWYQHGGHFTDQGTLLLSTHQSQDSHDLVVREYEVDDAGQVVREIWSAGVGQQVNGDQMGEAHRLPNGNTLHNFGTNAHLREYTSGGQVVWEVDWSQNNTIGRSEPVTVDLYDLAGPRI